MVDFSGLKALPGKIGDYLASDAGPVALGMGAQAAMGEHQDSWQALLGDAGVKLGRSNIAAGAAKRQGGERNQLANLLKRALAGDAFKFTDEGQSGPTTMTYKAGVGGKDTVTLKGDGMMGGNVNQSNRPLPGGANVNQANRPLPQGGGAPTQAPQAQVPQAGGGGGARPMSANSMLPFYLAQAATGGGGSGGDLRGLTPEQIQGISRTDILGQQALGSGVNNIFTNMYKQAIGDYYSKGGKGVTGPKTHGVQKGQNGNFWVVDSAGGMQDSGVPYQQGFEDARQVDLNDRVALVKPNGETIYLNKEQTPRQSFTTEKDLTDIAARLEQTTQGYTDKKGNTVKPAEPYQGDLDLYHRSGSPRAFMKVPTGETSSWSGKPEYEWKWISLPGGYKTSDIMEIVDIRRRRNENVTFEQVVNELLRREQVKGGIQNFDAPAHGR